MYCNFIANREVALAAKMDREERMSQTKWARREVSQKQNSGPWGLEPIPLITDPTDCVWHTSLSYDTFHIFASIYCPFHIWYLTVTSPAHSFIYTASHIVATSVDAPSACILR